MQKEAFLNRNTFFQNRFNEFKRMYERMALTKTECHPKPPQAFKFLEYRCKKKQMEKERQEDIKYNLRLLENKYREMYRKNNSYHPKSQKFFPHPSSLRFSNNTQSYYELEHQNLYLGKKLAMIRKKRSTYSAGPYLKNHQYLAYIGKNINQNSKYKNMFLDLVTPHTYEKRLYKLIDHKVKSPNGYVTIRNFNTISPDKGRSSTAKHKKRLFNGDFFESYKKNQENYTYSKYNTFNDNFKGYHTTPKTTKNLNIKIEREFI